MLTRRLPHSGVTLALAVVALLVTDMARNASVASVNDREFIMDKHEVTTDHKELAEFKRLLVAIDDALRKDAVERYVTLNVRLQTVMQRELEQTRTRVSNMPGRSHGIPVDLMRASTMDDAFGSAGAPTAGDRDRERRRRAAIKRIQKMEKLLQSVGELEYGLQRGDGRSTTRNAALLDQFLKLMREDIADIEEEIRERKEGE